MYTTATNSLYEDDSWGVLAVSVCLFWMKNEQHEAESMRSVPFLYEFTEIFPTCLHYLGRLIFLAVTSRLALVMRSKLKGLKEILFLVELKVIGTGGTGLVLDPVIV